MTHRRFATLAALATALLVSLPASAQLRSSDGGSRTIKSGQTLTIASGATLNVASGATFTNSATLAGGAITATDITGTDASLGIAGLAAAQGGAVATVGGTSSTSGNAGGAVTHVGGTPGATGVGGAVSMTGGAGGATSGAGGAASVTGGAGTAGNGNGGAASLVGGAAHGTGTGGAIAVTGGASAGASGTAGGVTIDAGAATGGTGAGVTLGGTNAVSATICDTANCDTVTVATNADADAINVGDSLDTVAVTSALWSVTGPGVVTAPHYRSSIAAALTAAASDLTPAAWRAAGVHLVDTTANVVDVEINGALDAADRGTEKIILVSAGGTNAATFTADGAGVTAVTTIQQGAGASCEDVGDFFRVTVTGTGSAVSESYCAD